LARWAYGGRRSACSRCRSVLVRGMPARPMIPLEERVRPGARAGEGIVLHDDRAVEHLLFLTVRLEPLVGLRPDALGVVHLAEPVPRAAARTVALVLSTHRLGTHVRDLGERAVPAVLACEQGHLRRLLER